jgi:pyruvate carboxylase
VKVTPSSKVVGDMALAMVSRGTSRALVEDPHTEITFPESVVDMLKNNLGQQKSGWKQAISKKVLKDKMTTATLLGAALAPFDIVAVRARVKADLKIDTEHNEDDGLNDEHLNGYLMYPKAFMDYGARHRTCGPVRALPTHTFFYGMEPGEQITTEIDRGKRLDIMLLTVGATSDTGLGKVFLELNGQPREISVSDCKTKAVTLASPKADVTNVSHIASSMPGLVIGVVAKIGQKLANGDIILQLEAMKIQSALTADRAGTLAALHVKAADQVETTDLLAEWENTV